MKVLELRIADQAQKGEKERLELAVKRSCGELLIELVAKSTTKIMTKAEWNYLNASMDLVQYNMKREGL